MTVAEMSTASVVQATVLLLLQQFHHRLSAYAKCILSILLII